MDEIMEVERVDPDARLLAIARANWCRRNFSLTLKQLCLKAVAKSETFLSSNKLQITLLGRLAPALKSLILEELNSKVFEALRYPAGKSRGPLVRLLIHQELGAFDFGMCGNFNARRDNRVWGCLADSAGMSLRSVRDLRTNRFGNNRSLGMCLPYLRSLQHVEELQITTLACLKGDLVRLVKYLPNLKRLQVLFDKSMNSFDTDDFKAIFTKKSLEEFTFGGGGKNLDLQGLIFELQKKMPWLKTICFRVDHNAMNFLYHNHLDEEDRAMQDYALEHYSANLKYYMKELAKNKFRRVKHMMLTDSPEYEYAECELGDDTVEVCNEGMDYTEFVEQLNTLHLCYFPFFDRALPTLNVNGWNLTSLVLEMDKTKKGGSDIGFNQILSRCPSLESLVVRDGVETDSWDILWLPIEDLKLKKLHLLGFDFDNAKSYFAKLLKAPLLEDLHLVVKLTPVMMVEARNEVERCRLLTNLQKFKFSLTKNSVTMQKEAVSFAKAILACSPILKEVNIELRVPKKTYTVDRSPGHERGSSMALMPFIQLVNS